jgi:hypothetical protein
MVATPAASRVAVSAHVGDRGDAVLVFCGGLIPVTRRPILDQLSWATPARWGFATTASTTDLRVIAPLTPQNETLWSHHPGRWLLNMTMLIALGAVLAGWVRWRIRVGRRITHRPPPRQTTMITLTSATYADAAPAVQA